MTSFNTFSFNLSEWCVHGFLHYICCYWWGCYIIICCSISIETFRWRKEYLLSGVKDPTLLDEKLENYDAEMVIIIIILVLGTVEFVIGIVTSICSCLMKPCTCCSCCETCLVHPQQVLCHPRQAIYGTFFPLYPRPC